jgi:GNAT superfamily N-acetyltransferase
LKIEPVIKAIAAIRLTLAIVGIAFLSNVALQVFISQRNPQTHLHSYQNPKSLLSANLRMNQKLNSMKHLGAKQKQREMIRFQIRRATLRDLDILVEQRRNMFEDLRHRSPVEHRVGDRSYRKFVEEMIPKGRFAGFLAETKDGTAVAGACVWIREVQPHPGKTSPTRGPYLMSVYTAPKFRGLGLATRVIKEAMKWAKKKGFAQMTLHASRMGRRLYKELGWERTWEMRVNLRQR